MDLRPGPHEVVSIVQEGQHLPMRKQGETVNQERAFGDQMGFTTDPDSKHIPGNTGQDWPEELRNETLWFI